MAEVHDILRFSAIGHPKAFSSEIRYGLAVLANLGVDMNERNVTAEDGLVLCEQQEK